MSTQQLTELEQFKRLVESADAKEILDKVLIKTHSSWHLKNFSIKKLGIDILKVEPIYIHKHFTFKRSYKDNIFMFIDSEYKIMAFLRGSKWEKEFDLLEDWYTIKLKSWQDADDWNEEDEVKLNSIRKIKKYLWKHAYHILMFERK